MTGNNPNSQYVLGSTDGEHQRLIRQAERLKPYTERLFRDAGIAPGQRVLDIGSGVGDVAMLVAGLVGSSGAVVGVERDERAIAKATARVWEARLPNATFVQADVTHIAGAVGDKMFDAAVGRFILQFLPDPAAILRALAKLVRPGGVIAFHEPTWTPLLSYTAHLPLWSACTSLIEKTFRLSGANTKMDLILSRAFEEAALAKPNMLLEMPMGNDSFFPGWVYDLLCSVRPQSIQHQLSLEPLGDFGTLRHRLEAEMSATKSPGACIALVSAWSRLPAALSR